MSCRKKAAIIGIIIAVSPCTVAWPRFMQTETLALAGTLWIFSALLNSVTQKIANTQHFFGAHIYIIHKARCSCLNCANLLYGLQHWRL